MRAWLRQHARGVTLTLMRWVRTPLASLLNIGVVGIALALPLAFYVVLANIEGLAHQHTPLPQLSVFMALDAQPAEVHAIEERLQKYNGVSAVRLVPRDQALAELKARSGLGDVIASLPQNPLPDAFVVDAREQDAAVLERMRGEFAGWPKVDSVQLDSAWARRLDLALGLIRLAIGCIGGLLAFALVAITFNTIRLQVLTQRAEIEIAKLIGATDAFIQRPFLYFGALLGLAGALAAWGMITLGIWLINDQLTAITAAYGGAWNLAYLQTSDAIAVCLLAAVLGWLGAWLSVSRNLAALDV